MSASAAPASAPSAASKRTYLSSGSGVNLALLRDFVRRELLDIVAAAGRQSKALVIDESLIGTLGSIAEFSALKERGVDRMYPLPFPPGPLPGDCPSTVIFITRPDPKLMGYIAQEVKRQVDRSYYVHFVPRKTIGCERALEREGVLGNILSIGEFPLQMVPLDSDLLTMNVPSAFRDVALYGDQTPLHVAARALLQLQVIYGIIPRICGKGAAAKSVAEMAIRMMREQADPPLVPPEIESVIIIDRSVDLATPLCTQLTYEGLVDEFFGIKNNWLELPEKIAPPLPSGQPTKVELNSGDQLYTEVRDLSWTKVGPYLAKKTRSLSSEYDEKKDLKTVSQIKQFTSKLQRLKDEKYSLQLHTDIATEIKAMTDDAFVRNWEAEQAFLTGTDSDKTAEYIEDLISAKQPIVRVLRLLCLQCVLGNGLKPKVFEHFCREILQTYGFEHMLTLENLQKAGLLFESEAKSTFPTVRKHMNLIVEGEANDEDISFAYAGYAPLSVRIVQALAKPGADRATDDVLKLLPGPQFETRQELPQGLKPKGFQGDDDAEGNLRPPVTLVFFIGGCTFAEVSCIRFLSHHHGRDFVVATTNMCHGGSFLEALRQDLSTPDKPPARKAPAPSGSDKRK